MSVIGHEAKALIQAISEANEIPKDVEAATSPVFMIEFFRGTVPLATIHVQEEWFGIGKDEYIDRSGVLKAVQRRVESNEAGRRDWVNHLARRVTQKPEFAELQSWSVETLQRYEHGQLRTKTWPGEQSPDKQLDYFDQPAWLKEALHSARLFPPSVHVHESRPNRAECVIFDWGYYGLVVGPSNYTASFQAWYSTNAAPGIFAYHTDEIPERPTFQPPRE